MQSLYGSSGLIFATEMHACTWHDAWFIEFDLVVGSSIGSGKLGVTA